MAGNFTRLNSGNWRARVLVDGSHITGTFPTKRRAEQWVGEQLNKKHAVYSYTLAESIARYKSEVSSKKKSHADEVKRIERLKRDHPKLVAMKLSQIESKHIEAFINERMETVKSSSVNRDLNLISHIFQKSIKWKWTTYSPTTHADRPASPPPRKRRITEEEIAIVSAALGYSEDIPVTTVAHRVCIAFLLAIETAMRCGEICSVEERDIDLQKKTIRLRAETTKTNTARFIPLSSKAVGLIKRIPKDGNLSWLGITPKQVDSNFRKYRGMTDIVDLHFHDTRHEATTRLAAKVHVLDLARITGHKDINQLLTYYNRTAADIANDLV